MLSGTDSMNFYANYQLARLYYQLGDYGRATEHYHILASIEGENPSILTGLADCHIKRGTGPNTMIALSLYARALELNPENVRVASSLINTLLRTDRELCRCAIPPCSIIRITARYGRVKGWLSI